MRRLEPPPLKDDIAQISFDPRSRDDIPQLLRGLQYLYTNDELRAQLFDILRRILPQGVDPNNGRPGMEMWRIFVLGMLRLNLNWDYDRLQEMANNHRTLRRMLGHGLDDDRRRYNRQTLKDNLALLTPEISDEINQVVVQAGHRLAKKKPRPR